MHLRIKRAASVASSALRMVILGIRIEGSLYSIFCVHDQALRSGGNSFFNHAQATAFEFMQESLPTRARYFFWNPTERNNVYHAAERSLSGEEATRWER